MNDSQSRGHVRLHVFGGLAAQLLGVSYAIYLKRKVGYSCRLVFDSGGTSKRDLVIRDLLNTQTIKKLSITYRVVAPPQTKNRIIRTLGFIHYRWRLRLSSLHKPTHRFGNIRKADLDGLTGKKPTVSGYPTDFTVPEAILSVLSAAIDETVKPNFLRPKSVNPGITAHWRLGDYIDNAFHGVIPPEEIMKGLALLDSGWESKELTIFTDSPSIVESAEVRKYFSRAGIRSADIWSDLYEMSSSEKFLGSHSAISQWVALSLSSRGKSSFLLPKQWFKSSNGDAEVLPTDAMRKNMTWNARLVNSFRY